MPVRLESNKLFSRSEQFATVNKKFLNNSDDQNTEKQSWLNWKIVSVATAAILVLVYCISPASPNPLPPPPPPPPPSPPSPPPSPSPSSGSQDLSNENCKLLADWFDTDKAKQFFGDKEIEAARAALLHDCLPKTDCLNPPLPSTVYDLEPIVNCKDFTDPMLKTACENNQFPAHNTIPVRAKIITNQKDDCPHFALGVSREIYEKITEQNTKKFLTLEDLNKLMQQLQN